jgi:diadenosine tetraphosphate (Ap4A) HIT family hydrolase
LNYVFKDAKELYGDLILEGHYWRLFLAPSQRYLGTCVLNLKRNVPNLRDLNPEEWKEFSQIVKDLEIVINRVFNPSLYNWACFKNASFRKDTKEVPQIHWHFHPRYETPITFKGITFEDKEFGYPPKLKAKEIPEELRKDIINHIRNVFKQMIDL